MGAPKNLGVHYFPHPGGHFGAPWRTLPLKNSKIYTHRENVGGGESIHLPQFPNCRDQNTFLGDACEECIEDCKRLKKQGVKFGDWCRNHCKEVNKCQCGVHQWVNGRCEREKREALDAPMTHKTKRGEFNV